MTGKLIPVPKDEINLSARPETPRTTQIREEIELICKAVSASVLFEQGQTHAIENMIDNYNEPDFDKPFVLETDAILETDTILELVELYCKLQRPLRNHSHISQII